MTSDGATLIATFEPRADRQQHAGRRNRPPDRDCEPS
jgi:hypothetical protein